MSDKDYGHHTTVSTLTRRELFAAMAMQGILANDKQLQRFDAHQDELFKNNELKLKEMVAIAARNYADALIKELEKESSLPLPK